MDFDVKVCTKFKLGMHEYSEIKKKDDTCLNVLMWKKIQKINVVGKFFVVSFVKNFIFHELPLV